MKEKLTLRNVVICSAAFIGILFFCLSFAVKGVLQFNQAGHFMQHVFDNAIWSCSHMRGYLDGKLTTEGDTVGKPFALPIIGLVLVLVAVLGAVAVTLLVKDKKLNKILLLVCGGVVVVGGVFSFFVAESVIRTYCYMVNGSLDDLEAFKNAHTGIGAVWKGSALSVVSGVFFIISGLAIAVSPFVPEKKLLK